MFGSNRNNSPKSRKRFWPFGRKAEGGQQSDNLSSPEETLEATSAAETPAKEYDHQPENTTVVEQCSSDESQQSTQANTAFAASANDVIHSKKIDRENNHNAVALSNLEEAAPEIVPDVVNNISANKSIQAVSENTTSSESSERKKGLFARMRAGLAKTRQSFVGGVATLLAGKKKIDDELLEELEMQLITADIGVEATTEIIESLTLQMKRKELNDSDALMVSLKQQLTSIIEPCNQPLVVDSTRKPYVILVVGVNGVGKTTTIGKLTCQLKRQGNKVMLAAGDTFRAAAVEQLQEWGQRNDVPVIAQGNGADSASVIYDAYEAARAREYDVLIADTAGRLHNKDHLMNELKKVKRVLGRLDEASPHEVMLVVDAGTGQNAISQATLFNKAVQLTGMTLTKLDGTAKGGIVFALAKKMQLPIRFLGVGEKIDDLRPFSSSEFVEALFTTAQPTETEMENVS